MVQWLGSGLTSYMINEIYKIFLETQSPPCQFTCWLLDSAPLHWFRSTCWSNCKKPPSQVLLENLRFQFSPKHSAHTQGKPAFKKKYFMKKGWVGGGIQLIFINLAPKLKALSLCWRHYPCSKDNTWPSKYSKQQQPTWGCGRRFQWRHRCWKRTYAEQGKSPPGHRESSSCGCCVRKSSSSLSKNVH